MTVEELAALFGFADGEPDAQAIELALEQGVLEANGDTFVVRKPRMLHAGAELVAAGIPLRAVLALGARLRDDMDSVARSFVELVAMHVFDPVGDPIPADELPRLTEIVRRLRPLAREAVDAELADAMGRHVQTQLRHRLDRMLEELKQVQIEAS
jgi:hypothetical protein